MLVALSLTISNYLTQTRIFEEKELAKLEGIASTLALELDGDAHQFLIDAYPEKDAIQSNDQDSIYLGMHKKLVKAMDANELQTTIYTMVYDSVRDKFCFGVSSSAQPFWKHTYKDYPSTLLENYDNGGIIPPYVDTNGTWLSAFEPIKNSSGNTVGVLQVDEQFDSFLAESRRSIWMNVIFSLFLIILVAILMYMSVRSVLKEQEAIKKEKEEVDQFRKELISNVSHDLRTPLSSIHGYIETILMKGEKLTPEKRNQYLETTLQNTDKLKTLVNELFELSKLEAKERKLNLEPFSLDDLVHDIANSVRINAEQKGVDIKLKIPTGLPFVKGDIPLIDRVFNNLLDNAIKFCEKGDIIEIRINREIDGVRAEVEDTGAGIASEDLEHVFDRFHKGEVGNKSGSGLGLAIVKNILELHNSTFGIRSEIGKGTCFWFTLPLA